MIVLINNIVYSYKDPAVLFYHYMLYLSHGIENFEVLSLTAFTIPEYLTTTSSSGDYITGKLGPSTLQNHLWSGNRYGPAWSSFTKWKVPSNDLSNKSTLIPLKSMANEEYTVLQKKWTTLLKAEKHFKLPSDISSATKNIIKTLRSAIDHSPKVSVGMKGYKYWVLEHVIYNEEQKKVICQLIDDLDQRGLMFPFVSVCNILREFEDQIMCLKTSRFLKDSIPVSEFARYCLLVKGQIFKTTLGSKRDLNKFWKVAWNDWECMDENERKKKVVGVSVKSWADDDEMRLFIESEEEDIGWDGSGNWNIWGRQLEQIEEDIEEEEIEEEIEEEEKKEEILGNEEEKAETIPDEKGEYIPEVKEKEQKEPDLDEIAGNDACDSEKEINTPINEESTSEISMEKSMLLPQDEDDMTVVEEDINGTISFAFKKGSYDVFEGTTEEEVNTEEGLQAGSNENIAVEFMDIPKVEEPELISGKIVATTSEPISKQTTSDENKKFQHILDSNIDGVSNINENSTKNLNGDFALDDAISLPFQIMTAITPPLLSEDMDLMRPGTLTALLDSPSSCGSSRIDDEDYISSSSSIPYQSQPHHYQQQQPLSLPEKIDKFEKLSGNITRRNFTIKRVPNQSVQASPTYSSDYELEQESELTSPEPRNNTVNKVKKVLRPFVKRAGPGVVDELKKLVELRPQIAIPMTPSNSLNSLQKMKNSLSSESSDITPKSYIPSPKLKARTESVRSHRSISSIFAALLDDNMRDLANSAEYRNKVVHPEDLYNRIKISTDKPWNMLSGKTKEKYYGAFLRRYETQIDNPHNCAPEVEDVVELVKVCTDFEDWKRGIVKYAIQLVESAESV